MDGPQGFASFYVVDVDWLLTWFPVKSSSSLNRVKIRGGAFRHRSTVLAGSGAVRHTMGNGQDDDDPIAFSDEVIASITVDVDENVLFTVELTVGIRASGVLTQRIKQFRLDENVRLPFMLNVPAPHDDDRLTGDTVVSFQGIFVTSPQLTAGEDPPDF